jgi:hypothetical protein
MAALAVILSAEGGVRAVNKALPEPIEWYDQHAQVKVEQMDRFDRRGRRADVVFAGTSQVFRGINPTVFDQTSDDETFSYNAALLSGLPPIMERWLLEEVEPRLKPRVVVWGLSSIDFHERRYGRPLKSYESAPATRKGLMASLQRMSGRLLELVKFRATLRDPEQWQSIRNGRDKTPGPVEKAREKMDSRGHSPKLRLNLPEEEERARLRDKVLRGYDVSDRGTKSITRIVRTLERRRVDVVFVWMPVRRGYVDAHPRKESDFEEAERHLAILAERLDVPFLDMSDSIKTKKFTDYHHLGKDGAEQLSRKLRRKLDRLVDLQP